MKLELNRWKLAFTTTMNDEEKKTTNMRRNATTFYTVVLYALLTMSTIKLDEQHFFSLSLSLSILSKLVYVLVGYLAQHLWRALTVNERRWFITNWVLEGKKKNIKLRSAPMISLTNLIFFIVTYQANRICYAIK